jgi:hypothetical protein
LAELRQQYELKNKKSNVNKNKNVQLDTQTEETNEKKRGKKNLHPNRRKRQRLRESAIMRHSLTRGIQYFSSLFFYLFLIHAVK